MLRVSLKISYEVENMVVSVYCKIQMRNETEERARQPEPDHTRAGEPVAFVSPGSC